ncbi:MAG: hypothetical protein J6V68_05250 [Clostridia bacterium]|nr:hypothetical protein [Clostridia bacterium]
MADFVKLLKQTNALKQVSLDKKSDRLSHAYLVLTHDKAYLREYLKVFAKLMLCKEKEFCDSCRLCRQINEEKLTDVKFFPKTVGDKITVDDANEIVTESFVKPYELKSKLFIIEDICDMNQTAQNKLLKTVEEPPENTFILIGASSEQGVLATIKSRVKKIEIPLFEPMQLFETLIKDCPDEERLKTACYSYDGTIGGTLALYGDDKYALAVSLAESVLVELNSSKDVLSVTNKITSSGVKILDFLNALEVLFRDMTVYFNAERLIENAPRTQYFKKTTGYNSPSALFALTKVSEAKKREYFNNNDIMLIERLLLSILEGKYKWKK